MTRSISAKLSSPLIQQYIIMHICVTRGALLKQMLKYLVKTAEAAAYTLMKTSRSTPGYLW